MASTVSVSKGVFVFKNGFKVAPKQSRKQKVIRRNDHNLFSEKLWYQTYKTEWDSISAKIGDLNNEIFTTVMGNLMKYIKCCYVNPVTEIPTACILTGINMPDHHVQFEALIKQIKKQVSPHVACLNGEDCQGLKYMVENMINQLMVDDDESTLEYESDEENNRKLKRSQCTLASLQTWYEERYHQKTASPKKQKTVSNRKVLIVIVPDFETFSGSVLRDFIAIAATYINVLPFVLIFGVATATSALHRSLPYHVSSKISIEVFNSPPAIVYLNNILENVFFSQDCCPSFHLGGKVFHLFTDIFLFYDLSVSGFVQNFKFAMLDHFSYGNAMALCCGSRKMINEILEQFNHEDWDNCRRLMSFRKLVEGETAENRIKLITDDDYFKDVLTVEIVLLQKYLRTLQLFIKCLHVLVGDLPKAPLGKQIREIYATTISKDITKTAEFQECFQLLNFQSKDEFCGKISKICDLITDYINNSTRKENELKRFLNELNGYVNNMKTMDLNVIDEEIVEEEDAVIAGNSLDRKALKEQLLMQMSKKTKPQNQYEKMRSKLLDFLVQHFQFYLIEPTKFNFNEIFFYNDLSVQNHLIGSHRVAIHTALNDPQTYLQCHCCPIRNESMIVRTMPDICVAYKLHLECGKMINLYDWLQAFLSIVDTSEVDDDSRRRVDPELQARFTQAVAELEYLGFIKSSKRKVDHVTRLTWGG